MATMLLVFLISCMIFVVYGLPMQIAPPQRNIEKSKYRRVHYEELGGGLEGDMLIPGFNPKTKLRGAAVLTQYKWPKKIISYDISAISDPNDRDMITNAMNTLMFDTGAPFAGSTSRYACIFFRPRVPADENFLTIQYGNGCSAHIGYWPNFKMTMTLEQDGCFYTGTIQHELMHVLGFKHEQARLDRDSYIDINLDNVDEDQKHNFDILPRDEWTNLNTNYDYNSIMHYGTYSFSKNGNPTIVPKQIGVEIGDQVQLSPIDIAEVRQFYGCTE